MINQQGLNDQELLDRALAIKDHRPLTAQVISALQEPTWSLIAIMMMALVAGAFPIVWPFLWVVSASILTWRLIYTRFYERLPLRQPFFLKQPDPQDRKPTGEPLMSRGAIYIGNEVGTGKEVWISTADALNHIMIFGATGAGKSELMLSLSFIYIAAGSGLFYIDPKASIKLNAQFQVMVRMCGRDDDFRLMNFTTGGNARRHKRPTRWPERRTNSTNQLSFLPRDACVQLIASLMPKSEGSNAIFSQNAMTLLTGLMYALVHMRDEKEIELSMGTLRTYLSKDKAVELAQRTDLPDDAIMGLRTFLDQMGYNPAVPMEKQARNFAEQYSYAANYFNQAFTSLIDTYREIFETTAGDIDMIDVIVNRRIVLALLPSLAKSPQECETLGKINLSAIRHAISTGLGDRPEGTIDESVNSLPLNADFPFASMTDEYAAITVPGYAEVATQGRGLGISATVGSQDAPGMRLADEKGYGQLVANTRLKAFGRVADKETMELLMTLAGEGYAAVQQKMTRQNSQSGGQNLNFRPDSDVAITKVSRIEQLDIQKQVEGQYTLFLDGRVVRVQVFYGNIPLKPSTELRLNRLVRPRRPNSRTLSLKYGPIKELAQELDALGASRTRSQELIKNGPEPRPELLESLRAPYRAHPATASWSAMDKAIVAFMRYARFLESPPATEPDTATHAAEEGGAPGLAAMVAHTEAWLFPSDEDDNLFADFMKIEESVNPQNDRVSEQVRTVLDAVHSDLRYPDSLTPAPDKGIDVVLSAVDTLMNRVRGTKQDGGR